METAHTEADSTLTLHVMPPRVLTPREELGFFEAAVRRAPQSLQSRLQLAEFLQQADRFDEALAVLCEHPVEQFRFVMLEVDALLSREQEADTSLALRRLQFAETLAQDGYQQTRVQATFAKVYARLGDVPRALASARAALALDPYHRDAFKRAVALELRAERPEAVLALADRAIAAGVYHSRVLCAHALAYARMGQYEEAREAQAAERFLKAFEPEPPPGWNTLAAFSQDLSAELTAHPDIRFNRYGTASAQTWRIDEPSIRRARVFPALQALIARELQTYLNTLPASGHPFLTARPRHAALRNWCVMVEGDGHEIWHVHQNGWLSGVFYAFVPDHIANGAGKGGCIAFGIPEDLVGEANAAAFGELLLRPRTGLMALFPSHLYHRTYPHYGTGRRICCAFDIIPAPRD